MIPGTITAAANASSTLRIGFQVGLFTTDLSVVQLGEDLGSPLVPLDHHPRGLRLEW